MRGNREFSGVVDIILASVRHEVHSGQADELQILAENVSEILPGPPERASFASTCREYGGAFLEQTQISVALSERLAPFSPTEH